MTDSELWIVNESCLQSYRSIFISSESFLLAVGAIVSDKGIWVLVVTAAISVSMIWFVWFPVVRARHRIVDYWKYRAALRIVPSTLCSEKDYVLNKKLRGEANAALGIKTNWRPTRWKIDFLTPVLFSAVWVVLVAHELVHRLTLSSVR